MTVECVESAIREIKEFAAEDDDGQAHKYRDMLWYKVLVSIAVGAENPKELAAAALAEMGDFCVWYE